MQTVVKLIVFANGQMVEWQTRNTQNVVPLGVWVQVPVWLQIAMHCINTLMAELKKRYCSAVNECSKVLCIE